jgi:uncharacterized protein (DUF433 family)
MVAGRRSLGANTFYSVLGFDFYVGSAGGEGSKRRYIYKSTAMKKYGLTRAQIEEAIRLGLITDYKYVQNPHSSSAPPALLIGEEELAAKLEEIKKLPRYTEAERARRRLYRARKKQLDEEVAFLCPICNWKIEPLRDSLTRKAFMRGDVTAEEARIVAVVTHFRHAHTSYDRVRSDAKKLARYLKPEEGERMVQALERYLRLKRRSSQRAREEREYLLEEFRWLKAKALEKAKRESTEIAIMRAKEAGLLPPDMTYERYAEIAEKVLEREDY